MNCLYTVAVAVFALNDNNELCLCLNDDSTIVQAPVAFDQQGQTAAIEGAKTQLDVNLHLIEFVNVVDTLSHFSSDKINPSKAREISSLYVGVARSVPENCCLITDIEFTLPRAEKKLALQALESLCAMAERRNIGVHFLNDIFTIPELYNIYVQLWPECNINLPNFRRKIKTSKTIEDTFEYINGSKAYSAGYASLINPPFSRISLKSAVG